MSVCGSVCLGLVLSPSPARSGLSPTQSPGDESRRDSTERNKDDLRALQIHLVKVLLSHVQPSDWR